VDIVNHRNRGYYSIRIFEVGLIKKTMVGQSYDLTAGDSVKITCGKSSIQLDKDGTITISGVRLDITGTDHEQITGDTDIN
jgi:type VI secretion system secreted protein VgrG